MYTPDRWMILKITGADPHYRVFGSWFGGYLGSDSWRMNSGIVSVEQDGEYFIFKGSSGSEYHCHKKTYGSSSYGYGVAAGYEKNSDGKLEILQEMPDILTMDRTIS